MLSARLQKITLAFCSGLSALVVGAGVGEIVVRHHERHRHTPPGTMPFLYYRSARYGYSLVRNSDYYGWAHVDGEGFRGREVSVTKAPGSVRLMIVGSSTAFDVMVAGGDSAAWPARLEYWLNRLAGDSAEFEVINAGVPGYSAADDLIRLELELYRYHPDIIVFYDGHNDLSRALLAGPPAGPVPEPPRELGTVTPWGDWLRRHSLLYGKLFGRYRLFALRRWQTPGSGVADQDQVAREALAAGVVDFEHLVDCFATQTAALGIQLVIPKLVQVAGSDTSPGPDAIGESTWSRWLPQVHFPVVLESYHQYNAALERVASRHRATWIPTDSFGLVGPRWYRAGDPMHFNEQGADRMGKAMAEALLRAGGLHLQALGTSRPH
ncbi:MAG TPA: GDSL-type esterase/lipase family protein [Gemmatimonadales bacterium]|nr:GDSL-type esterase/lipase family protein [Gemmatimonadales bacterium]